MTAEPAKAKEDASAVVITISFNPSSGYGFSPNPVTVPNLGTVQFIAPQACWVWTFVAGALANVFTGEQSDHVQCAAGPMNDFTVLSQYSNTTVTIVGTALNAAPPPPSSGTTDILKGTIHVGS
jgi:hypothetical protein